ncbi:MAG TPA: hypothetical protein VL866_23745 [Pyrinomonadaceae bacterium]|nr:hypothetical protein [Pyrinomonadaceae bacterium]
MKRLSFCAAPLILVAAASLLFASFGRSLQQSPKQFALLSNQSYWIANSVIAREPSRDLNYIVHC